MWGVFEIYIELNISEGGKKKSLCFKDKNDSPSRCTTFLRNEELILIKVQCIVMSVSPVIDIKLTCPKRLWIISLLV